MDAVQPLGVGQPRQQRARTALLVVGIFAVVVPSRGVCGDVFPNSVEILLIPNDVLIIIALPDGRSSRSTLEIDPFRGGRFEQTNDGRNSVGCWFPNRSVVEGRVVTGPYIVGVSVPPPVLASSPTSPITMIPCKWFGMITNASNVMRRRISADRNHSS